MGRHVETGEAHHSSNSQAYRRGLGYAIGVYVLWGVLPVYWKALEPTGLVQVLAQRVIWSVFLLVAILAVKNEWSWLREVIRTPRLFGSLVIAGLLLLGNWLGYLYGVNHNSVLQVSLGYFMNPLVTILLGVFALRERLRKIQWLAVALTVVAVVLLSLAAGGPPLAAFSIALSFGFYGLVKKRIRLSALQSLTVENAVLFPAALGYVVWLTATQHLVFGHATTIQALLLVGSGAASALPLVVFSSAAQKLPLSVLGLVQYLAPVMQFLLGVFIYHEPITAARLIGFVLVWVALVILSAEGLHWQRKKASQARAAHRIPAHLAR